MRPTADMMRRYEAYVLLLAQPDPTDLPARGSHYTYAGDPRRRDRLKRELSCAYLRHRIAEAGREETTIGAVRRVSRLRLVPCADLGARRVKR